MASAPREEIGAGEAPGRLEAALEETLLNANVGDQPTDRDTLGFSPYVRAIADFLVNPRTRPPLTLSIEGEWGSGKSSFLRQLQRELRNRQRRANAGVLLQVARGWPAFTSWLMRRLRVVSPHAGQLPLLRKASGWVSLGGRILRRVGARFIWRRWIQWSACLNSEARAAIRANQPFIVEFNAWRHDKEDALWAAFALHFHDKLAEQLRWPRGLRARLRLLMLRFNWRQGWFDVVRVAGLMLLFAVVTGGALIVFRDPQGVEVLLDAGKWKEVLNRYLTSGGVVSLVAFATLILIKLKDLFGNPLAVDLKKHLNSPDYAGRVAFIEKFHEDFNRMVEAYAGDSKVFVFIDDLDRCEVPKAADLMQALNLMISDARQLVFLIGMDREKVAAGLAVKHEKLLPYLAPSPAGPDGKPVADPTRGIEYGYGFIEKFIQVPFLVPQPTLTNFDKLYAPEKPRVAARKRGGLQDFLRWDWSWRRGGAIKVEAGLLPPAIQYRIELPPTPGPAPVAAAPAAEAPLTDEQRERRQYMRPLIAEDQKTLQAVIPLVAQALDNNPRRLKQFINLFRLRGLIAIETGLFDVVGDQPLERRLTRRKLAKFVALSLKWPLLVALLEERPTALAELQMHALNQLTLGEITDPRVRRWAEREQLSAFLRVGCIDAQGKFDEEMTKECGFRGLDVSRLLQVSPAVERPRAAPQEEAPARKEVQTPTSTAPDERQKAQEPAAVAANRRAIDTLESELRFAQRANKRDEEVRILLQLGDFHQLIREHEEAAAVYQRGLSLAQEIRNPGLEYRALMKIGDFQLATGDDRAANERFEKALEIARSLGRQEDVVSALLKLAESYERMRSPEQAFERLNEALTLARSLSGPASEIQVLLQLGETFVGSGNPRRVMEYFDQALAVARRTGDGATIANVLLRYGGAMEREGEFNLAISQTLEAINILTELNHPSLPQAQEQLERIKMKLPA